MNPFKLLCSIVVLAACSGAPTDGVQESSEALSAKHGKGGVRARSVEYANLDVPIPAGIAAGEDVFFVGSPLEGRVLVVSRKTRAPIAELPQPPGNFILPLILHSIGPSRVAVLDSGGLPAPGVSDADPTIYEYEYRLRHGVFTATLARTVHFTGNRIGFAEEFAYLGSGRYLVTDAVYGSIWGVTSHGEVRPGIVPKTFEPADRIPELSYCPTMPQIEVGGLPFLFTGSTIPGAGGIDVRDGTVFVYSSCAAALYKFPLSILADSRAPYQRVSSLRLVSKKPENVPVEELLELQFNPYDPSDPYLYGTNALELRVIRIDSRSGAREVLGDDPRLFNFPSSLAFIEPKRGERAAMLVLSNQQHRTTVTNDAIDEELTEPPFIVAKLTVSKR